MSTTIRPAFFRPMEFISATTDFTTSGAKAITSGVYANVISLFREFASVAGVYIDDIGMSDSLKLKFQAGETGSITWDNATLRDVFGFTGASVSITDGEWYTATYTPLYTWIPEHTFADQGAFRKRPIDMFVGEKTLSGNLSGIVFGSTSYQRDQKFNAELGVNLGEELATTSYEKARCLDLFLSGSVQSTPTVSSYPDNKGFWYYQNVNDAIADCTYADGGEWATDGGIEFGISDTYVFCHFDPNGVSDWRNNPIFRAGRIRYNVELSFTTASSPGSFL